MIDSFEGLDSDIACDRGEHRRTYAHRRSDSDFSLALVSPTITLYSA